MKSRIRSMQRFFLLILLLSCSAWADDVKTFKSCLSYCIESSPGCKSNGGGHLTLCRDHQTTCIDRCDPRRQHKATIEVLFPTTGKTVDETREQLKPKDRHTLCSQDCAMMMHSCVGAGNDNNHCAGAKTSCLSRCDAHYDSVKPLSP